jgi:hypothetical protein
LKLKESSLETAGIFFDIILPIFPILVIKFSSMKNLLYILLFFTLALQFSCGSEKQSGNETSTTEEKDTLDSDSDTLDSITKPVRKRMERHMGFWIDRNLDNAYFFSERVDEWVDKSPVKFDQSEEDFMDYEIDYLKANQLKKLTTKEIIYYALAYPSSFSQVCAEGISDTSQTPKISGYIPFSYDGEEMSDIQWDEINFRRDSVILLLTEFMLEYPEKIETEYLRILKRLDAYEAIPAVIATASKNRPDNYSFLLEMMYDNEFSSLRNSDIYNRLYGEESSRYDNRIESTSEVRKKIIRLGEDYYGYMHAH